jgi:phosphotriesterase-related protein
VTETPFVRTVLGDIEPGALGVTYAHEHLVILESRTTEASPDLRLDSVDDAVRELAPAQALGLRAVVDGMPADTGRDAEMLAAIARRTGLHVIAPTGIHHIRHYGPRHWTERLPIDEIAGLFIGEIEVGIDRYDLGAPIVHPTPHRAGVIKVAGSEGGPSPRDARIFEAAAIAQARTGCPILTHCEHGTGGVEQVALLERHGARAAGIALSHVDKVVDRGYQRELLATGATLEYDQSFRWGDGENGTLRLLEWAAEDGALDRIVLGMDAARRSYWAVLGGSPGMAWLLGTFTDRMRAIGLTDADLHTLFVTDPARLYAFAPVARRAPGAGDPQTDTEAQA